MAVVVGSLESILTLQERTNNSMQAADRRIFSRMLDMFSFHSNGENSAKRNPNPSSYTKGKSRIEDTTELPAQFKVPSLKEFKFADLERATSNFSPDLLFHKGGLVDVFIGWVDKNTFVPSTHGDGIAVAVRRYSPAYERGREEWLNKVVVLATLDHRNIISLMGYCNDKKDEYLLVYEYMHNKTLHTHLFSADISAEPLSWGTRLRIMIGVARGLTYLHSSNVIHRDVKSKNISLDQDFNAKLDDFDLARFGLEIDETYVSTRVMGSFCFLDPEYFRTCQLTVKSDVYSFGVVLLETLTAQKVIDVNRPREQIHLVPWAFRFLEDSEELKEIIDPRLEKNYPKEGVFEYAKLTLRCTLDRSIDRPSSEDVLSALEQIYAGST